MKGFRARLRRSFGGKGASGFVSIGVVAALATGSFAIVLGEPVRRGVTDLLDGHTWLSNPGQNQLLLANGSSAQVDLKLTVKGAGGRDLEVLRAGKTAVFVDKSKGQIGTIDLEANQIVNEKQVGTGIELVAAHGKVIIVRPTSGLVESRDPQTNALLSRLKVGRTLSRGVADAGGTVWVLDKSAGDLIGLSVDSKTGELRKASSASITSGSAQLQLTLVDGSPAVLDPSHRQLIKAPGGSPAVPIHIDLGSDGEAKVAASVTGSVLPIAISGTGTVIFVSGSNLTIARPAALARDELGEPQVLGGRVYVPDYGTGSVLPLTLQGEPTKTPISVVPGGGPFTARVDGGYVWFDNPSGDAKVVDAAGVARKVDKGRPVPSANTPLPTNTAPTPAPSTSPTDKPLVTAPSVDATSKSAPGVQVVSPQANSPGPTIPTVAPSAPSQPGSVSASPGNASAIVQWIASDDHGSRISGYAVTCSSSDGGPTGSASAGTALTATVDHLKNGKTYTCSVTATNGAGSGSAGVSPPFKPTAAVPDTPDAPSAVPGDKSLQVSFAPLSDDEKQGVPVVGYQVSCDGATSPIAAVGPVTVGGLVNGTAYTCTVTARTASGPVGAPSAASAPRTPFGSPSITGATANATGQTSVHVSFAVSANGGSPSCSISGPGTQSASSCSGYDVSGLSPSTGYSWTLTATNAGAPPQSVTVNTTTQTPPPASINISWGPYGNAVGAPLTVGPGTCTDPSCTYVDASIQNFSPNASVNLMCWSNDPSAYGDWRNFNVVTDGNGSWSGQTPCFFGFVGKSVYLHSGSTQSNTITR